MNVEVTRLPESRVALKVELSAQEVGQALDRTYKQLVQRVTIPGFRKGKAPRPILERMIGHEVFLHEATEEAIRWGYRKAVDQSKVTPIDEAEIKPEGGDHAHLESGGTFTFEATVAVRPDVQLPDIHAIHVERNVAEVTDEDVDATLTTLRERNATLEPVGRVAQIGDVVTMNITGRSDGQEVISNDNQDYELRDEQADGPDPYLPGLSAELSGAARGDIREIVLHLPDDYRNSELAGKSLILRALIKEIKRKVIPDLDDDFAQSVSEFETVEKLREALRSNLELERKLEADEKLVNDAVEAVTSRTFVEIPQILIDEELDRMVDDLRRTFEQQRMSFDTFVETSGRSEADIRRDMHDGAVQNVKTSLVLSAVADTENIEIRPRDVDVSLDELLRASRSSESERRQLRSSSTVRANIRSRLRRQRAIQKLVEIVTGGEEISSEAAGAVADQTAGAADDTEETVAVEVGG